MAALFQRKSDGRWIARFRADGRVRYITGVDRADVIRRSGVEDRPVPGRTARPAREVFDQFVVRQAGCWPWAGPRNWKGYGELHADGRRFKAHRWAYETMVGPIPDGFHIDHLCRNRSCVNPAHLEPVTPAENVRRGAAARRAA